MGKKSKPRHVLFHDIDDSILKIQAPRIDQHADGQTRDAFTFRMGDMPDSLIISAKAALSDDFAMTQNHRAMLVEFWIAVQIQDEVGDPIRSNALALGRRPRKWLLDRLIQAASGFLRHSLDDRFCPARMVKNMAE